MIIPIFFYGGGSSTRTDPCAVHYRVRQEESFTLPLLADSALDSALSIAQEISVPISAEMQPCTFRLRRDADDEQVVPIRTDEC